MGSYHPFWLAIHRGQMRILIPFLRSTPYSHLSWRLGTEMGSNTWSQYLRWTQEYSMFQKASPWSDSSFQHQHMPYRIQMASSYEKSFPCRGTPSHPCRKILLICQICSLVYLSSRPLAHLASSFDLHRSLVASSKLPSYCSFTDRELLQGYLFSYPCSPHVVSTLELWSCSFSWSTSRSCWLWNTPSCQIQYL